MGEEWFFQQEIMWQMQEEMADIAKEEGFTVVLGKSKEDDGNDKM